MGYLYHQLQHVRKDVMALIVLTAMFILPISSHTPRVYSLIECEVDLSFPQFLCMIDKVSIKSKADVGLQRTVASTLSVNVKADTQKKKSSTKPDIICTTGKHRYQKATLDLDWTTPTLLLWSLILMMGSFFLRSHTTAFPLGLAEARMC